jgi:hypothetical protein
MLGLLCTCPFIILGSMFAMGSSSTGNAKRREDKEIVSIDD